MKNSKWIKGGLVSLALALTATNASATESGFYLGFNIGQSNIEVDSELVDIFNDAGGDVDDSDTAWSLAAGYRFNPYVGVELAYVDLGEATLSYSGGSVASIEASRSASGLAPALVIAVPSNNFEFNFKLGMFLAETDADISSRLYGVSEAETFDASTEELLIGLGMGYTIADHVVLRLDWTRYSDVGDEDETTEGDVDTITVGLAFRF